MPGTLWKPVVNHGGAMGKNLGLILHVCQGNGSQFNHFNTPSPNPVSSTWWTPKAGVTEQYVDSDEMAWAQADGNYQYNSVETEGFTDEPLTASQMAQIATIYMWGHAKYGWPIALAEAPGESGFGWHGMGGAAWGGHTGCPGSIRLAERVTILAMVGVTMALTQADVNLIWSTPILRRDANGVLYSRTALQELADCITVLLELRTLEPIIRGLATVNPGGITSADKDDIAARVLNGLFNRLSS